LGVGTSSPAGRFQIIAQGTASTDSVFSVMNSANNRNLISATGDGTTKIGDVYTTCKLENYGEAKFYALTYGVGHIKLTPWFGNGGTSYITAGTDLPTNGNDLSIQVKRYVTGGNLIFETNDSERMRVQWSGEVGIGTNAPSARLDVRAQGALSTDLAFRIRNSANTDDLFSVNGTGGFVSTYFWSFKRLNGTTLELYSLTTGFSFREGGTPFALLGLNESRFGNTNSNDSVLSIRTSTAYGGEYPLGSILQGGGTNGSVVLSPSNGVANKCMLGYYNGTSWVSALEYNNTASGGTVVKLLQNGSGAVSIGQSTNGARLDIRAQGALSTDIAFRVRNSANTADLFSVLGNGTTALTTLVATNVINISQPAGAYYPTLNFSNNGGASQGFIRGYNGKLGTSSILVEAGNTLNVNFSFFDANYAQLQVKAKDALSTSNSFGILDSALSMYFFKVQNNGAIGIGTSTTLSASAKVQIDSTTQGFLPPRMTNAERTAIASPAVGLMVYCTDAVEGLYIYKSTGWTFVI
jgi:hypothetical protein